MDLNLYPLKVFVEVVRERSLTRAAAKLGISQPAVSAQIKGLEEKFGDRLWRRGLKETGLTVLGEEVYAQALLVLAEVEELECLAAGSSEKRAPTLGASSTPGAFWLPGKLQQLHQIHGLRCDYRIGNSAQVRGWVLEGSVLFGLVGELTDFRDLEQREFGRDSLQLMGPHGHPLAGRTSIKGVDFRGETLLLRDQGSSTRARAESLLSSVLPHFGRVVELNSGEAIKEAVLAGLGLAVLSSWSVRRELKEGLITALDPKRWSEQRPFYLIRRARRPVRGQAALLWNFLAGTQGPTGGPRIDYPDR